MKSPRDLPYPSSGGAYRVIDGVLHAEQPDAVPAAAVDAPVLPDESTAEPAAAIGPTPRSARTSKGVGNGAAKS